MKTKKITIGITDCSKYPNYENWILKEPGVSVIKLGYKKNNLEDIEKCSGIILSGGEDIHPAMYQRPEYLEFCHRDNIDERRDEFEWKVLDYARSKQLPLLGICRGLQLVNIYFGGTLVPDHEIFEKPEHRKFYEGRDRYHIITVKPGTELFRLTGKSSGKVNSAHHQSIDVIGEGLKPDAYSGEIIEGMELKEKERNAFLLLVQWHPERMDDQENVFTKNLKAGFLKAAGELI